jgi:hypothetical protein
MIASVSAATPRPADVKRGRRTLLLIVAIGLAPIVASYAIYYLSPRQAHVNYGELLATTAAPLIDGVRADGRPFSLTDLRGRWAIVMASSDGCDARCERMLYATRQARTIQGSDQERVARVWLTRDGGELPAAITAEHPGLERVRVAPSALATSRFADGRIYLIDPLGNWVLAWPADPDIKKLANDLGRLLRASQIG